MPGRINWGIQKELFAVKFLFALITPRAKSKESPKRVGGPYSSSKCNRELFNLKEILKQASGVKRK